MEQTAEFSFFQESSAASDTGMESPKPMPAPAQVTESSTSSATENDSTTPVPTEEKVPEKQDEKQRKKVPFEKGYSQMDWLKLTQTHPDLAGLNGRSNMRKITMEEVRQHRKKEDAWTVLRGRVYNITPYFDFHPGGLKMLMKAAGKDCTSMFDKYHTWVNAEFLLARCLLGVLDSS